MPNGDNQDNADAEANAVAPADNMFIKNYGLFWKDSNAFWGEEGGRAGTFWGVSTDRDAREVDFRRQIGLYALYDIRDDVNVTYDNYRDHGELVYCGYSGTGAGIGNGERRDGWSLFKRIRQHQQQGDGLFRTWNQFSWFGIGNLEDGDPIDQRVKEINGTRDNFLYQMESVMIRTFFPTRNDDGGHFIDAKEYLQFHGRYPH